MDADFRKYTPVLITQTPEEVLYEFSIYTKATYSGRNT